MIPFENNMMRTQHTIEYTVYPYTVEPSPTFSLVLLRCIKKQAQWQLGRCYATGHGTKVKPEKAKALFQRASDQGHPKAKEELLRLRSDETKRYGHVVFQGC